MSSSSAGQPASWRQQVLAGRQMLGTFVKTPAHATIEVLAWSGLDYLVLDAEHAPIARAAMDTMLLAARAASMPTLVRVASNDAVLINECLDLGADGILVPHICTPAQARQAVAAAKYSGGTRGLSPSTRAGRFGTVNADAYAAESDRQTSVWCQIEDAQALDNVESIARVANVDCLFLGRQDLALSLGVPGIQHPQVVDAVHAVARAGRAAGVPVAIFVSDAGEIPALRELGISAFVCGSDQSLLLAQARALKAKAGA